MAINSIPDDLYAKIVQTFCSKDRMHNGDPRDAMAEFLAAVDGSVPLIPHDVANAILDNPQHVDAFINKVAQKRKAAIVQEEKRKQAEKKRVLARLKEERQSVLISWQNKIKKEVGKHGIPIDNFEAQIARTNPLLKYVAFRIMEAGSLKTLVAIGVALAFGVNVAASEFVEWFDPKRDQAIAFIKQKFHDIFAKDSGGGTDKEKPKDMGYSGDGTVPLSQLPYVGLGDPNTGKGMLDLLNEGQTVRLFKQDGSSICLQMPKPIPCVGADVPKPQPPEQAIDAVKPDTTPVAPPQPHRRHMRRHHRPHSCAQ